VCTNDIISVESSFNVEQKTRRKFIESQQLRSILFIIQCNNDDDDDNDIRRERERKRKKKGRKNISERLVLVKRGRCVDASKQKANLFIIDMTLLVVEYDTRPRCLKQSTSMLEMWRSLSLTLQSSHR
jgi:hypothetical protein